MVDNLLIVYIKDNIVEEWQTSFCTSARTLNSESRRWKRLLAALIMRKYKQKSMIFMKLMK